MNNLPVILIEVVLIFGSVLAFSIWQLRSIKKPNPPPKEEEAPPSPSPPRHPEGQ
ncbi:MAG: hypothetical protein IPG45_31680 [Deltaproteobacteria bacterium]|nr:hypothetical protein [Deltaproteobacteria bacterium]